MPVLLCDFSGRISLPSAGPRIQDKRHRTPTGKRVDLNFYPLHREINILFLDGLPSGVLGEAVRLLR